MLNAWERERLAEIEDRLEAEDPQFANKFQAGDVVPPGRRRGWWVATTVIAAAVLLSAVALAAGAYAVMLGFATVATVAASIAVVCCWPYPWRLIWRRTSSPHTISGPARGQPSDRPNHRPNHYLDPGWWAPWLVFPDDQSRHGTGREGEESR